jgi:hypothetical protein
MTLTAVTGTFILRAAAIVLHGDRVLLHRAEEDASWAP